MRKHLIKYVALGGVLAAPLAAAVPASAGSGAASAAGISATGLVNIPATPAVSSVSGPHHETRASLPGNPLAHVSALRAEATSGHSAASVVDLRVAQAAILPKAPVHAAALLSAKLISARCDDGAGGSRLVDVQLAGRSIQAGGSPNSTITVPVQGLGGVRVTVNKQVRGADGRLTVTALELAVRVMGKSQLVDIASATCGAAAPPPGEAPAPTPVPSDLPVTG
jgi:hypothetical protein